MRWPAALLTLLVAASALPAPASGADAEAWCVPGEPTACGLRVTPPDARAIVLILHGYGHTSASHEGHLEHLAAQGVAAVAMDYRGTGFPLRAGADDSKAAILALRAMYPDAPAHLYSVSMGTAVAALVLSELPSGFFDVWVNNEGLAMLHETWAGASALSGVNDFARRAKSDIEAECGGTPAVAPECYLARSAALHADRYGLEGVFITHGLNDGLVPYDQGREMHAALVQAGIPTDFHTVGRGAPGGEGTTITGYAGVNVDGLAGHGTESNDTHTLTRLSFELLDAALAGARPTGVEHVRDRDVDTLP